MSVAAVYAMWPWDDLATALVPNGRLLSTANTPPATDIVPVGVGKESWINDLYFETAENYLAPPGADPQTDLTTWKQEILAGEPYSSTEAKALSILQTYKSAIGVPMPAGGPAPTAIQSGWTDTLFPASEALHYANRVRASGARTPMLLMFDDVGHGWAQDKPADVSATTARGLAFLNSVMLTHRQPPTGVVAIPTTCPASAPSGSPRTGATLAVLQSTPLSLSGSTPQTVTSTGGSPTVAASLNAAYVSKLCNPLPATAEPGTAVYKVPAGPAGATLMGAVSVTAAIKVTGNYPELVGRLWDVSPSGTRQIVALGVVRPFVNQKPGTKPTAKAAETLTFDLDPNNYTFAPGDTVELELVGSTAPLFRKSNGTFTVTVDHLVAQGPHRGRARSEPGGRCYERRRRRSRLSTPATRATMITSFTSPHTKPATTLSSQKATRTPTTPTATSTTPSASRRPSSLPFSTSLPMSTSSGRAATAWLRPANATFPSDE